MVSTGLLPLVTWTRSSQTTAHRLAPAPRAPFFSAPSSMAFAMTARMLRGFGPDLLGQLDVSHRPRALVLLDDPAVDLDDGSHSGTRFLRAEDRGGPGYGFGEGGALTSSTSSSHAQTENRPRPRGWKASPMGTIAQAAGTRGAPFPGPPAGQQLRCWLAEIERGDRGEVRLGRIPRAAVFPIETARLRVRPALSEPPSATTRWRRPPATPRSTARVRGLLRGAPRSRPLRRQVLRSTAAAQDTDRPSSRGRRLGPLAGGGRAGMPQPRC